MSFQDLALRLTGLTSKMDENLAATAAIRADLTKAHTDLATRDAEIGKLKADLATRDGEIATLKGQLTARDGEVTTLKASVETEKNRANATLAAQGIKPEDVPAAETKPAAGKKENAFDTYHRLLAEGKPAEAGAFYAANVKEIYKQS